MADAAVVDTPPVETPPVETTILNTPPPAEVKPAEVKPVEVKPDLEKPKEAEPKPGEKTDADATKKPDEVYELKAPEGSLLKQGDVDAIKALKLPKDQSEAMLASHDAVLKRYAENQTKTVEATKAEWKKQAESDPVIGGEKFAENTVLASRGFQAIADKETVKFMEDSGLGNHPIAIRMFAKLGRMMAEDRIIPGTAGNSPAKVAPEDVLYGKKQ